MAISSDSFLEALDGRSVSIESSTWVLEVYAIVVEAKRRWIQLHAVGPTRHPLRINASLETTPPEVLAEIAQFLEARGLADSENLAGATIVIDGKQR